MIGGLDEAAKRDLSFVESVDVSDSDIRENIVESQNIIKDRRVVLEKMQARTKSVLSLQRSCLEETVSRHVALVKEVLNLEETAVQRLEEQRQSAPNNFGHRPMLSCVDGRFSV